MDVFDNNVKGPENEALLRSLRQELKEWELAFLEANNRKAERNDIKQHPAIGEKYKRYNQLRYPPKQRIRRTHSQPSIAATSPSKRQKQNHSHSFHPSAIDPYDPPTSLRPSSITHRISIGPTPQKDGMVLGLFDALSSGLGSKTPSKPKSSSTPDKIVQATPTKASSTKVDEITSAMTGRRHHRSPLSASNNFGLNQYLTPSARRVLKSSTPGSQRGVSKLRFDDTPAFLRRDSQRTLAFPGKKNAEPLSEILWSPIAVRKQPMPAGRGLSALVKGLRDMEDERLDEELDLLRDIEDADVDCGKVQETGSLDDNDQRTDMPLGPDGGLDSQDDSAHENEGKGRDGKPLKVWEKKGQKRTTRKVIMKPNVEKWKPEPAWQGGENSEGEESTLLVNDTQAVREQSSQRVRLDDESTSENEDSLATVAGKDKATKKGIGVRMKNKKISTTAHANFRALKIKNKQSKGKFGSRFGRR